MIHGSADERRLMIFVAVLALVVLVRGVLPVVQGLMLDNEDTPPDQDVDTECAPGFLVWWIASELLLESGPLCYLLSVNNRFLRDKQKEVSDRPQSLVDYTLLAGDHKRSAPTARYG
jgi:hypothetical protein